MELAVSAPYMQSFVLVLARIGGVFFLAPVFGFRTIPARVKVGLAATVTLVLTPLYVESAGAIPAGLGFFTAILSEALIGLAIGYVMSLVIAGLEMAATVAGLQIGFGLAEFFDPTTGEQANSLQLLYTMLATLTFLAVNGHHLVLGGMADSFQAVGLGSFDPAAVSLAQLTLLFASAVSLALRVAMPVVAGVIVAEIGLVAVARAMPQANIFMVGFPVKILAGLMILLLSLPFTMDIMAAAMARLPGQIDFLFPRLSGAGA